MAIINKMRKSGWVFVVILGALALFVLSDLISGFQKGGGMEDPIIGEVAGVEIKYSEYDEVLQNRIKNKEQAMQGQALSQSDKDAAANEAWDDMFRKYVIEKEYEKLGLTASNDELYKLLFTDDAHPFVKQYFTQEDQPFAGANVLNWYREVYPTNPNGQLFFNSLKEAIVSSIQSDKYRDLIQKGIHVTDFDAATDFVQQSRAINGSVVGIQASDVPDTAVSYSDEELKKYYTNNKNLFKNTESRNIEYVVWNAFPSTYDTIEVKKAIEQDFTMFENSEDDSSFAALASERPIINDFRSIDNIAKEFGKMLPNAEIGQVLGPIQIENTFVIAKVSDVKESEELKYKYGHFAFYQNWTDKQDSLAELNKAKEFVNYAKNNSYDDVVAYASSQGIAILGDNNGDLPWTSAMNIDQTISDAIVKGKKGDVILKPTQGAINILIIRDNPTSKEYRLVEIYKEIQPSMATINESYSQASRFRATLADGKNGKFDAAIEESGLAKRVASDLERKGSSIPGLQESNEIIRWIFDEKVKLNDISEVFSVDGKQVVVHISSLKNEGIANFDEVIDLVKDAVSKEKKLEYIEKKLADAAKGKTNPIQVALEIGKVANDFNTLSLKQDFFSQANNEAIVQGAIIGFNEKNKLSRPVKGENGAYIFMISEVTEPSIPEDLESKKQFVNMTLFQTLETKVVNSLKKISDIKDERAKYF